MAVNGSALELGGYRIYYGTSSGSLANVVTVSPAETSYVFKNLTPGTWYFAVTAVNVSSVESSRSAVVPADT